jgi:hypothetical protein
MHSAKKVLSIPTSYPEVKSMEIRIRRWPSSANGNVKKCDLLLKARLQIIPASPRTRIIAVLCALDGIKLVWSSWTSCW